MNLLLKLAYSFMLVAFLCCGYSILIITMCNEDVEKLKKVLQSTTPVDPYALDLVNRISTNTDDVIKSVISSYLFLIFHFLVVIDYARKHISELVNLDPRDPQQSQEIGPGQEVIA